MNDLRALHLIYSAIKYYQTFGVSPEIRDELLTVASRATGRKPQTLSAAVSEIEIAIAKLRAVPRRRNWRAWARSRGHSRIVVGS
jgi:hypothetical protein